MSDAEVSPPRRRRVFHQGEPVRLTDTKPRSGSPRAGDAHSHRNQCQGFLLFFFFPLSPFLLHSIGLAKAKATQVWLHVRPEPRRTGPPSTAIPAPAAEQRQLPAVTRGPPAARRPLGPARRYLSRGRAGPEQAGGPRGAMAASNSAGPEQVAAASEGPGGRRARGARPSVEKEPAPRPPEVGLGRAGRHPRGHGRAGRGGAGGRGTKGRGGRRSAEGDPGTRGAAPSPAGGAGGQTPSGHSSSAASASRPAPAAGTAGPCGACRAAGSPAAIPSERQPSSPHKGLTRPIALSAHSLTPTPATEAIRQTGCYSHVPKRS